MSHRKLLRFLKKSKVFSRNLMGYDSTQEADAQRWKKGAVTFLENCSAFYIDEALESLQAEEIIASASAMKEAGVFNLPAVLTYIECSFDLIPIGTDKGIPSRLAVMASGDLIRGAFIREKRWRKDEWVGLSIETQIDLPLSFLAESLNPIDRLLTETNRVARMMTVGLIVLLCTKGIEAEFIPSKHCKLTSRGSPQDGYTIVHVKRAIARQHLGGTIDERKRVRLHMRRGHVRHQKYGPKRCHERIIWIAPQLIGYEEEGRIEHDYLV